MRYQYIPYIWPLIISTFFTSSLGVYGLLKRQNTKGALSFTVSMAVVTIWSLGNVLEMSSIDFSTKLFWANIQYIAYCYSPVTLLALCMQFTGYDHWIVSRKILWTALIPTIIIILVWTDSYHGLVRFDMQMDYRGSFPVIAKTYGPAFYIHAIHSHMLNITAWILLIKAVFIKNTVYKKQASVLLIGVSMIVIPNILYITGLSPVKRFDITPIFFVPAGLIMAWGIFRFKLFELIPIARASIIETMDTGVMVLDLQDRVSDINTSFQRIVGYDASKVLTKPISAIGGRIPGVVRACTDRTISRIEFSIDDDSSLKLYEALISPLTDDKGIIIGRLVMAYDITEKKQEENRYIEHEKKLAMIKERENVARDMHDNLGQVLGFINLQAQGIRQELMNEGVNIVSGKLDKLVSAAQTSLNEIREYIRSSRETELFRDDFMTSLQRVIKNFEEQSDIGVKLDVTHESIDMKLRPIKQKNILNIIRESLNNIHKHAKANQAKINIIITHGSIDIVIEDDGKGFDINGTESCSDCKFGLNIMIERAREIGAQIKIQSVIGRGSQVSLHVPIEEDDNNDAIKASSCR